MKKHFFFDMDGTLTQSRAPISDDMLGALQGLVSHPVSADVVIVSGASLEQIDKQVGKVANFCFKLAQNGNDAYSTGHEELWRKTLPWDLKFWIFKWIYESLYYTCEMREWQTWPITNVEDLVEDRGCQISFSIIGHHAPIKEKRAFDPDHVKRKELLRDRPWTEPHILVAIGGTTCLDFYRRNKGMNVATLMTEMKWKPEECVYIGDALFEGGNDESVMGVIDCMDTSGPENTIKIIEDILKEI
jgi:phosphomannomutase